MHKRYTVPMIILFISGLCYSQSEQPAMTTDGRQVILKSDRTWSYVDEQPPLSSVRTAAIVGDDISEIRKLVDSINTDLAQSDWETTLEYSARLKRMLGEKRLSASDHSLYRSVIVIDSPDLSYSPNISTYDVRVAPSSALDSVGLRLVQRKESQWTKRNAFRILFPMSVEMAPIARPDIKLAIYGFPVLVSENKLSFVPTKYVVFNGKTGKQYMSFVEANLMVAR